jgi:hypothetical protein
VFLIFLPHAGQAARRLTQDSRLEAPQFDKAEKILRLPFLTTPSPLGSGTTVLPALVFTGVLKICQRRPEENCPANSLSENFALLSCIQNPFMRRIGMLP